MKSLLVLIILSCFCNVYGQKPAKFDYPKKRAEAIHLLQGIWIQTDNSNAGLIISNDTLIDFDSSKTEAKIHSTKYSYRIDSLKTVCGNDTAKTDRGEWIISYYIGNECDFSFFIIGLANEELSFMSCTNAQTVVYHKRNKPFENGINRKVK